TRIPNVTTSASTEIAVTRLVATAPCRPSCHGSEARMAAATGASAPATGAGQLARTASTNTVSASVTSVTTGIGQGQPPSAVAVSRAVASVATVAPATASHGRVSAHTKLAACTTAVASAIGTTAS